MERSAFLQVKIKLSTREKNDFPLVQNGFSDSREELGDTMQNSPKKVHF